MDKFLGKKIVVRADLLNIIIGAVVMLFNIFLITIGVPKFITIGWMSSATILTTKTFPRLVAWIGLVLGVLVLVNGVKEKKENDIKGECGKEVSFYGVSIAVMLLCVFFISLLKKVGYPIVNMITLLGMYYVSGGKKLSKGIIMAVVFTLVSTWFFFIYLKLSIPMGILEDFMYANFY